MDEHRIEISSEDLAAGVRFKLKAGARNVLIAPAPAQAQQLRLVGMFFDTNHTFLLPGAIPGLRRMVEVYEEHKGSQLLVVGHTDSSGDPSYNDPLSLARARMVVAYLKDDVDAWLAQYGQDVLSVQRWGAVEDRKMLMALPIGIEEARVEADLLPPGDTDADRHAAQVVRVFQKHFAKTHQLVETGTVDDATRRAIVTEYMARDATTLPGTVTITAHGCGENFPDEGTGDGQDVPVDRRIDMFLFNDAIAPAPSGDNSGPGTTAYPTWKRQASVVHTFSGVIPTTPEADLDFDSHLLIVNHCTRSIDRLERTRAMADELVSQFKGRSQEVCYIISPDDDTSAWFTTDREPSFAIASVKGHHEVATSTHEITAVGGYFDLCLADAISSTLTEFFQADATRTAFVAHLPLGGVYYSGSQSAPPRGAPPFQLGFRRYYTDAFEDPATLPDSDVTEQIRQTIQADESVVLSFQNLWDSYGAAQDAKRAKLLGLLLGTSIIEMYFNFIKINGQRLAGIDWKLSGGSVPTLHMLFIRDQAGLAGQPANTTFAALADVAFEVPDLSQVIFENPSDGDDDLNDVLGI